MNKTKLYTSLFILATSASGLSAAPLAFGDGAIHNINWTQLIGASVVDEPTKTFIGNVNAYGNSTINLSLSDAGEPVIMPNGLRLLIGSASGGGNISIVDGELSYMNTTGGQPINIGEGTFSGTGKTTSSLTIASGATLSSKHNLNVSQNATHISTMTVEGTYKFTDTTTVRSIGIATANDSEAYLYVRNGGVIDASAQAGVGSIYSTINIANTSNSYGLLEVDGATSKIQGRFGIQMGSGAVVNSTSEFNIKNGATVSNTAEALPGGMSFLNSSAKSSKATITLTDKSTLSFNNDNALRIAHGAATNASEGNTATINVFSGSTFSTINSIELARGAYNTAIINVDGKSSDGQASSMSIRSASDVGLGGSKAIINVTNGGVFNVQHVGSINNSIFTFATNADAGSGINVSGAGSEFNIYSVFTANVGSVSVTNGGAFNALRNEIGSFSAAVFATGTSLTVDGAGSVFNASTRNIETSGDVLVKNGGKIFAKDGFKDAFYQSGGTVEIVGASKIQAVGKFNCVAGTVTLSLTNANVADDSSLTMISAIGTLNFTSAESFIIDGSKLTNQDGAIYLADFINISFNDAEWDRDGAIDINDFISSFAKIQGFDETLYGEVTFDNISIEDLGGRIALVLNLNLIPEPSTYAAIFGLLALTFAIYRRRK